MVVNDDDVVVKINEEGKEVGGKKIRVKRQIKKLNNIRTKKKKGGEVVVVEGKGVLNRTNNTRKLFKNEVLKFLHVHRVCKCYRTNGKCGRKITHQFRHTTTQYMCGSCCSRHIKIRATRAQKVRDTRRQNKNK